MRNTWKKMMALVIAVMMVMAVAVPVVAADDNSHTITITPQGNGQHTYTAYQVFKGNLDAAEHVLSNIEWGTGVTGSQIIAALQADDTLKADFPAKETITDPDTGVSIEKDITYTAADVAKKIATYTGADNAAKLKAFAIIVGGKVGTAAGNGSGSKASPATITVTGDGYYLIKDTGTIPDGDTQSEFILEVVDDIDITAKDDVITPDKEIEKVASDDVKADNSDAAIGDTVTFTVDIKVPDTSAYKKDFWFVMTDQLPAGLTFTGITSVKVAGVNTDPTWKVAVDDGTAATSYTAPSDPVTATGGNKITLTFTDFKDYVVNNNAADKILTVTYTAVINDDAVFGQTGNENTVQFEYSNNPNVDYDGDDITPDGPTGKTPESKTKNFVTKLKITKVDGANSSSKLAGAVFEITGTTFNKVLETGEKYVETPYPAEGATLPAGETVESGTYYKLVDGSYTSTAPKVYSKDQTGGNYVSDINLSTEDQYDNVTKTYVKVSYSRVVTTPASANYRVTTDKNGLIQIEGLKAGTYTVKEVVAPDGYNLDPTVYTLVIDWDDPTATDAEGNLTAKAAEVASSGGFSLNEASSSDEWTMSTDGAEFSIQIVNNAGSTLPSTGGMGTTLFYLFGTILVIGAGVLLVTRRRVSIN